MNHPVIDFGFAPRYSWTAICRADDPHKSVVDERGALLYRHRSRAFEAWSFDLVVELGARAGSAPRSITQTTETPGRAIVVTTLNYDRQQLVVRHFGHQDEQGRRVDIAQYDLICIDAVDADLPPLLAGVQVALHRRGTDTLSTGARPGRTVRRISAGEPDPSFSWPDDTIVIDDFDSTGEVVLVSTEPLEPTHMPNFLPGDSFGTVPMLLAPGERLTGAIAIPLDGSPVPVDLAWAQAALEQTRQYWDDLELRRATIEVPDVQVQQMIDAASRNVLQAREVVDGNPQLQVGPVIYRGLWVIDGHFMMECARYLGLDDAADAAMIALLKRVREDGSITDMLHEPHIKETGIAIASMVRAAQLSGNLDRLRDQWPLIVDAGRYLDTLVEQAEQLPAEHPLHGLVPPAFGDGGIAGARAELTTIMWILTGMKYAVEAARVLGTDDLAEHQARFDRLNSRFEARRPALMEISDSGIAHLPQSLSHSGRHAMVPDVPDALVRRHRQTGPATATWAFAQAVWPGELFTADDPAVTGMLALFDESDDIEGIPAETGWLPYESLWGYHASFAAHAWLFAGRGDKAADYLYAFANHASPTRVWREEQGLKRGDNDRICGDMPHNWGSAEFIRLAIHLLAFERGDELLLLAGLPSSWTGPAILTGHPTRFGPLDLRVGELEPEGRSLVVDLGEPTWQPAAQIRVRLPEGTTTATDGTGAALPVSQSEGSAWITLPGTGHHEVVFS